MDWYEILVGSALTVGAIGVGVQLFYGYNALNRFLGNYEPPRKDTRLTRDEVNVLGRIVRGEMSRSDIDRAEVIAREGRFDQEILHVAIVEGIRKRRDRADQRR